MRESVINYAKNELFNSLKFLDQFGYAIEKYGINEDGRFEVKFSNNIIKKDIFFVISDSEQLNRFHITISIVRKPYSEINDFVDFKVYLNKNKIAFRRSLEGNEINEGDIHKYIEDYSELFKAYGIELIATDKQFPHYFPEWI